MLLKFYCSNFKSIKDEIEFSMFSGTYKRHDEHITTTKGLNVLRASAIYGNNGSGKTNMLLALRFLHTLVVKGTRDINQKLNIPVFKLSNCESIPTRFEIDYLMESRRFVYRLELLGGIVQAEELYEKKDTDVLIFKRKKDGKKTTLTIAPNRDKKEKERLREEIYAEELRDNQTFFNEAINKRLDEVRIPYLWFKNKLKFVSLDTRPIDHITSGLPSTFFTDSEFLKASRNIVTQAKVGITDFKLQQYTLGELKAAGIPFPQDIEQTLQSRNDFNVDLEHEGELYSSMRLNGEVTFVKISTTHENADKQLVDFKFTEESQGVQKLLFLLPALYRSIHKGEIFVIDEIENSFHPVLLKEVIQLYLNSKATDPGQLIFTTHESHLLDLELFRQDEIWFCEKDKIGSTRLYSLAEFKPRFDKDIRKGYLEGQFGYIPFIGHHKQLEL